MESRLARLFGGGLGLTASLSCLPAVALCPADLPQRLAAISVRPELSGARLGVQVETLSGTVVYSQEGDRFFVPASTLKLLTTAAALTVLGPDHTLPTTIMGASTATGRTALTVVGGGDPTISTASLDALAQQLAPYDLSLVEVLYGDESALPGAIVNPHWEWEDVQAGYGAPVNALILNENEIGLTLVPQQVGQPLQVVWDEPAYGEDWAIDNTSRTVEPNEAEFVRVGRELGRPTLRVGGQLIAGAEPETAAIAEPNPGLAFLAALQAALATQGIRVQQTHLSPPPAALAWQSLAAIASPPLAELLIPTNQDSNNLYAEALLKTLGRQVTGAIDATDAGLAVARRALQDLGLDNRELVMVDGSGLARKNLVTPRAMVDVLQGMARSPHAVAYRNSLAVAAESGTLSNRLQGTPAAGRLYGKSGAISRNFGLAGYLDPPDHPPLAFSILLNNINVRGSVARGLIDDVVVVLAELSADCD